MLTNLFNTFYGKNEDEYLPDMENMLLKAGFTRYEARRNVTRYGEYKGECVTIFYVKEGAENAFAYTRNTNNKELSIILPTDFVMKHFTKNGEFRKHKTIGLKSHSFEDGIHSPVMTYNGKKNVYLSRIIMQEAGYDIKGLEVDHSSYHKGINIPQELRPCSRRENLCNRITVSSNADEEDEFAYNESHDFRYCFWIPFLHYVLGVISYDDMVTLKQMKIDKDMSID